MHWWFVNVKLFSWVGEKLANFFLETLRKYPIVPILNRECNKDYRIPGTQTIIEKGTAVIIPLLGLQRDPKFYPEPNAFRPERFFKENAKSFTEQPYIPFGEGPRNCIGLRLGKLQVKVGLMLMLQKNSFFLQSDAKPELDISPKIFVMGATTGIHLKIKPRRWKMYLSLSVRIIILNWWSAFWDKTSKLAIINVWRLNWF